MRGCGGSATTLLPRAHARCTINVTVHHQVRGRCAIERLHISTPRALVALFAFAVLLLAACGGNANVPPTHVPTRVPPTPTPRSTPLPPVENAPELGQGPRALELIFTLGDANDRDARRARQDLQRHLADALEMDVRVTFADEIAALDALCSGAPRAAWVSAPTYYAAATQCGAVPALALQRGRPPTYTVGRSVEIVGRIDVTGMEQLKGRVFCRSDETPLFTSWVAPALLMAAEGANPQLDLAAVRDYPDDLALAQALYEGDCAAAALPPERFDDLVLELATALTDQGRRTTEDNITAVMHIVAPAADTEAPDNPERWDGFAEGVFPYEVLVFAPESASPEDVRAEMAEAVQDFFDDRAEGEDRLSALLDAAAIMPVSADDYAAFRAMLAAAHWDMTFPAWE